MNATGVYAVFNRSVVHVVRREDVYSNERILACLTTAFYPRYTTIFIKTLRETTLSIIIDSNSTIGNLKTAIYVHEGILPIHQRLFHGHHEYSDDFKLSDLPIANATLTLLLRLMGGVKHKISVYSSDGSTCRQLYFDDGTASIELFLACVCREFEFDRCELKSVCLYDKNSMIFELDSLDRLKSACQILSNCRNFFLKLNIRSSVQPSTANDDDDDECIKEKTPMRIFLNDVDFFDVHYDNNGLYEDLLTCISRTIGTEMENISRIVLMDDRKAVVSDIVSMKRLFQLLRMFDKFAEFKFKVILHYPISISFKSIETLGDEALSVSVIYYPCTPANVVNCHFSIKGNALDGVCINTSTGEITLTNRLGFDAFIVNLDMSNPEADHESHLSSVVEFAVGSNCDSDVTSNHQLPTAEVCVEIDDYELFRVRSYLSGRLIQACEDLKKSSNMYKIKKKPEMLVDCLNLIRGDEHGCQLVTGCLVDLVEYFESIGVTEGNFVYHLKSGLEIHGIESYDYNWKAKTLTIQMRSDEMHLLQSQLIGIFLESEIRPARLTINEHVTKALLEIVCPALASFLDIEFKTIFGKLDISVDLKTYLKLSNLLESCKTVHSFDLHAAKSCPEESSCAVRSCCKFHKLPPHVQVAACYCERPVESEFIHWPLRDMFDLVLNFYLFPVQQVIVTKLRDCLSGYVSDSNETFYFESFEWMQKLLTEIGCGSKIPQLLDVRNQFKTHSTAKNSIDDFDGTVSLVKLLTNEQWQFVKPLIESTDPCRLLVDAPAGSGKTLMAIKLCVAKLMRRESKTQKILLLTHSRALAHTVLVPGIENELNCNGYEYSRISDREWNNVFQSMSNKLYVSTFDDLIRIGTGSAEAWYRMTWFQFKYIFNATKFDLIIIDEGKNLFSRQDDPRIEGQHLIPAEWAKDIIEWQLHNSSQLLIFHEEPLSSVCLSNFPENLLERKEVVHHIVRCPGHVRDATVLFNSDVHYDETGIVKFNPLLDVSVKGPPILTYKVGKKFEYGKALAHCLYDLEVKYGGERLSNSNIAIITSLTISELKESTLSHSVSEIVLGLVDSSSSDACDTSRMFFGPMENFVGLERPFIVFIGDIDSTSYSVKTRCTFQLCLVSMSIPDVAAICETEIGEEITNENQTEKPIMLLNYHEILVPFEVDLNNPSLFERSEALEIRINRLTLYRVRSSAFNLRSCHKLKILDLAACMENSISIDERHLIMDDVIGAASSCPSLIRLNISRNRLQKLSGNICLLSKLEWLDCSSNDIKGLSIVREGLKVRLPDCKNEIESRCLLIRILKEMREETKWNAMDEFKSELNWMEDLSLFRWDGTADNGMKRIQLNEEGHVICLVLSDLGLQGPLPYSISCFPYLAILILRNNCITGIPDSIEDLESLKTLDISANKIVRAPCKFLIPATNLNYSDNPISEMQRIKAQWVDVKSVDLYNFHCPHVILINVLKHARGFDKWNEGMNWSECLKLCLWDGESGDFKRIVTNQCQNVTELRLNSLNLFYLPDTIRYLENLTYLDVSSNKLSVLPQSIGCLRNLAQLHCPSNQFSSLPESICGLFSLTILDVSENRLVNMPDSLSSLPSLTSLIANGNRLISLLENIGNLQILGQLLLERNELSSVPNSICRLLCLRELNLSSNRLSCLPENIGDLVSLSTLDLRNNRLPRLPPSLFSLISLTNLNLDENELLLSVESRNEVLRRALETGLYWNSTF